MSKQELIKELEEKISSHQREIILYKEHIRDFKEYEEFISYNGRPYNPYLDEGITQEELTTGRF